MADEVIDLEKYRSVGVWPKGKRLTKVTRTDKRGSTQTDHWDGRRDANIHAVAATVGTKTQENS